MKHKVVPSFVLFPLALFACGDGSTSAASGAAPTLEGEYAFGAASVTASSQTGGGFGKGDNLTIFIGDGCRGSGDKTLTIQLFSQDKSSLVAGEYSVETPKAGGSNLIASVRYQDFGGNMTSLSAKSGTVIMENIDTTSLKDNRGSFSVTISSPNGGSSQLSGTFDGRYVCK